MPEKQNPHKRLDDLVVSCEKDGTIIDYTPSNLARAIIPCQTLKVGARIFDLLDSIAEIEVINQGYGLIGLVQKLKGRFSEAASSDREFFLDDHDNFLIDGTHYHFHYIFQTTARGNVYFKLRDETHITHLKRELASARAQLESLMEEYRDSVRTVVHDIRGPLTSIGLSARSIERTAKAGSSVSERYIQIIYNAVSRLESFLSKCTHWILIGEDRVSVSISMVPLYTGAVFPVVQDLSPLIEQKEAEIAYEMPTDPTEEPVIKGDAQLLKIILSNWVSNALRYGGEKTKVTIGYRLEGEYKEVYCRNSGSFFDPAADTEKMFAQFSRLDKDMDNPEKGTGLGLYICRKYAELMGYTLKAASDNASWAEFALLLPNSQKLE